MASAAAFAGSSVVHRWHRDPARTDWWRDDVPGEGSAETSYIRTAPSLVGFPAAAAFALTSFERFLGAQTAAASQQRDSVVSLALEMREEYARKATMWLDWSSALIIVYSIAIESQTADCAQAVAGLEANEDLRPSIEERVALEWARDLQEAPPEIGNALQRSVRSSLDRLRRPLNIMQATGRAEQVRLAGPIRSVTRTPVNREGREPTLVVSNPVREVSDAFTALASALRAESEA